MPKAAAELPEADTPGLPEGWTVTTIGEVAEVVGGGTPDSTDLSNFEEGNGHAWITPADLSGFEDIYISRGKRALSDRGLRTSSAKIMPAGAVLMSSRAPIGYLAIASGPVSTNQGFKSFVCHEGIVPEFIYFWLKSIQRVLGEMGSGSTFAEISGRRAKQIPLSLPPTAEQRRIAAGLQQLLPQVAQVAKRLARVSLILKRFRQSVLAAACCGRLTEEWRDKQGGLEFEWKELPVSELLSEPLANGRSVVDDPTGFPVLRLTCLKNGRVDLAERKNGAWTSTQAKRFVVAKGDFFVARGNGSLALVGRGGLVDEEPDPVAFPDTLIRVRVDSETIVPGFLRLVWNAQPIRNQVEALAHTTAGIWKISQKDVEVIRLPVPRADEQHEIVHRVETLFKLADAIERRVAAAAARVEKTNKSILASAFRGGLVPTEAELARREGRGYESASELLVRIRAARERRSILTRPDDPLAAP